MADFNFYFTDIQKQIAVADLTDEQILRVEIVIFIVVPALLAIMEYCMIKKNKQTGLYPMNGAFVSAILFGLYSVFVGLLLLIN